MPPPCLATLAKGMTTSREPRLVQEHFGNPEYDIFACRDNRLLKTDFRTGEGGFKFSHHGRNGGKSLFTAADCTKNRQIYSRCWLFPPRSGEYHAISERLQTGGLTWRRHTLSILLDLATSGLTVFFREVLARTQALPTRAITRSHLSRVCWAFCPHSDQFPVAYSIEVGVTLMGDDRHSAS